MRPILQGIVLNALREAGSGDLEFQVDPKPWSDVAAGAPGMRPDIVIVAEPPAGSGPPQPRDVPRLGFIAFGGDGRSASVGTWHASPVSSDLSRDELVSTLRALCVPDADT